MKYIIFMHECKTRNLLSGQARYSSFFHRMNKGDRAYETNLACDTLYLYGSRKAS